MNPGSGAGPVDHPVVYFDGVCGLCNRFVDFLLRHDRRRFRYAPLQGRTAAARLGPRPDGAGQTIVLEDETGRYRRSDAVIRAVARLGGLWRLVSVLGLVPRPLRDAVYDGVARNRYAWFGRRNACRLPGPGEQERFLP